MSKIIFCGDIKFPHGSASANYVQCLASAFIDIGYNAIVCSTVDEHEMSVIHNGQFRGITVYPLSPLGGGLTRIKNLKREFLPRIKEYLDAIELGNGDILVSYAITPEISAFVLKYAKKRGMYSMACPVEWFDSSRYKGKILSYHYWVFARNFYMLTPKFDLVFSISTRIHEYFLKRKANSLLIPCLVDTNEFNNPQKEYTGKIKILFPGVPGEKGAFSALVNALDKLSEEELTKIEIHFTRVKEEQILPYLNEKLRNLIGSTFVLHGWLDYSKLVELYQTSHYMYLCREESRATLCNFPSKGPETMQYGVVPIVTKLADFENLYLSNNTNSIILESLKTEEVYNTFIRIIRLKEEEYLVLSMNARKTAVDSFDYHQWSKIINRFLKRG